MTSATRPLPNRPRHRGGRPARAARNTGPDPQRLAGLLVRVWLEVRAGRRPLQQLAPLVAPVVYRRLTEQLAGQRDRDVARVGRVHACSISDDVCEAAVTIHHADRITALAVRLERHLGLWRAVELTAPEAGLAPLVTASLPSGWRPRDAFDEVFEEEAAG